MVRNTWAWGDEEKRTGLAELRGEPVRRIKAIKPALRDAIADRRAGLGRARRTSNLGRVSPVRSAIRRAAVHLKRTQRSAAVGIDQRHALRQGQFPSPGGERRQDAVNPAREGTKFAAWHVLTVAGGQQAEIELVLSAAPLAQPFAAIATVFADRQSEADGFYRDLLPEASDEDQRILRQASAGMIWSKAILPLRRGSLARTATSSRRPTAAKGRNRTWRHLKASTSSPMPDKGISLVCGWDLAYHCAALSLVDVDFAKDQIELVLRENYLHPNGQIPAYEWAFGDVNPPVHAMGALKVFRAERVQRGQGDLHFLERVFHKLLLNYAWWINRKDSDGNNVFEGGFLRAGQHLGVRPLPPAASRFYALKQADATGWMAMFALNMTVIALELAAEDREYENIAIQIYQQFLAIANYFHRRPRRPRSAAVGPSGFLQRFDDFAQDGRTQRIDVYSWVGLIPLFVCEVVDRRILARVPVPRTAAPAPSRRVRRQYHLPMPGLGKWQGEHLLSLVTNRMPRILKRLLREDEFLSPHGIRSVSRIHATHKHLGTLPGVGEAIIEYVPGESNSGLFGGNSNWRPDLATDQLHVGAGAGEVPSFPRRQLHHRRAQPGQSRAEFEGNRHADRRAAGGHLSPRYGPTPAFPAAARSRRFRTGDLLQFYMNTSMATPAGVWAPPTRPAGPVCWRIW